MLHANSRQSEDSLSTREVDLDVDSAVWAVSAICSQDVVWQSALAQLENRFEEKFTSLWKKIAAMETDVKNLVECSILADPESYDTCPRRLVRSRMESDDLMSSARGDSDSETSYPHGVTATTLESIDAHPKRPSVEDLNNAVLETSYPHHSAAITPVQSKTQGKVHSKSSKNSPITSSVSRHFQRAQSELSVNTEHGRGFVSLHCSVWDAVLLVGMRTKSGALYLGVWNSLLLLIATLATIAIQCLFILAVNTTLTVDEFPTVVVDAIFRQRLHGQSIEKLGTSTMTTVAQDICSDQDHSLLADTHNRVEEYLQLKTDGVQGRVICLLALIIWTLSTIRELRRTVELGCIMAILPSPPGRFSVTENGYALPAIVKYAGWTHRVFLVVFVFLPRFVIAMLLLLSGIMFMSVTLRIEDLILNACALEVVKNVDELLFCAISDLEVEFAVARTVVKTYNVDPTVARFRQILRERLSGGGPGRGIFRLIFLAVIVGWGYFYHVKPFHEQIEDVHNRICGGDTAFVYFHTPGMPLLSTPQSASGNENLALVDDTRCLFAAQYEMLALRAGFAPKHFTASDDMYRMASGTHPTCNESIAECPEMPFSIFISGVLIDPICEDQPFSLRVLQKTCTNEAFRGSGNIEFFKTRASCADFANLCLCPDGFDAQQCMRGSDELTTSDLDYVYEDGQQVHFSVNWWRVIREVCPRTCGVCHNDTFS